jgi:hypothetical protein
MPAECSKSELHKRNEMEEMGERRRTEKTNCRGTKFGGYVTSIIKLVLMGCQLKFSFWVMNSWNLNSLLLIIWL